MSELNLTGGMETAYKDYLPPLDCSSLTLEDLMGLGPSLPDRGHPRGGAEVDTSGITEGSSSIDLNFLLGSPGNFALPLDVPSLFNGLGDARVRVNGTRGCKLSDLGPFAVNPNSGEFDVLKELPFALLVIVLYIAVIFLGTVGNTLVVLTVIRTKKLWNATNIFIANLAFSDVFVCVFDLPISAYYQITDDWIFGSALCKVIPVCFAVIVYASTLTLTMIAVDRYLLIVMPLKRRMSVKLAMFLVFVIATLSIAVASPIALYSKYVVIDDKVLGLHRRYCLEEWPTPMARFLYTIITLILQFFVPLIIIAILYSHIFKRVRSRVKTTKHSRKTKTTKMLVAVVSVFAITWTPFHLYAVITEVHYDAVKGKYYKFLDALLRLFAMLSSCLNPFLYGWLNDNYRNAFLSIIRKNPQEGAHMVHREDSDEMTRRSVVNGSPSKRGRRTLVVNGKVTLAPDPGTFMLKNMGPTTEGQETHNNNVSNSGRSPLLPKYSPV